MKPNRFVVSITKSLLLLGNLNQSIIQDLFLNFYYLELINTTILIYFYQSEPIIKN